MQSKFKRRHSSTYLILINFCNFREIRASLVKEVEELKKNYAGLVPGLAIVQVGAREDSNVYIRMKMKAAEEIGISATHLVLPSDITQHEVIQVSLITSQGVQILGFIVFPYKLYLLT